MTFEQMGPEHDAESDPVETAAGELLRQEEGDLRDKLGRRAGWDRAGRFLQLLGASGAVGLLIAKYALDIPVEANHGLIIPPAINFVLGTGLREIAGSMSGKISDRLDRIKTALTKK